MVTLPDLWLPILLSAVFVFVASSIIHMCLPIHKSDYRKMPNEGAVLAAMRENGMQPGTYMFPCAGSMKEMCSPEMVAKCEQGPVGLLTVRPSGVWRMGPSLAQWFVFSVVVGVMVAYAATLGLKSGDGFAAVFWMTGPIAFLGYGVSHVPDSIWKAASWVTTAKFIFDGLVYGIVTGCAFGWLWPG